MSHPSAENGSLRLAAISSISGFKLEDIMILFIRSSLTLSLSITIASVSFAQNTVPRFSDYSVSETHIGQNASIVLKRDDMMYRSRLREAAKEKPNFAGHFIIAAWGCGAQCLMGAVINAKTGRVNWIPHTTCCWGTEVDERFEPIEFRLNSRLIVFSGLRDEKEGDDGAHLYKFENGRFVYLRSVLKQNQ